VRRIDCPSCGVVAEQVSFARPGSRFTRAFEDTAVWLAHDCPKSVVARLMRVDWATVGRMLERVVAEQEGETHARFTAVSRTYDSSRLPRPAVGWRSARPRVGPAPASSSRAPRAWLLALDRLRTARQKPLLEASQAVRMPSSVRVSSLAALGPHNGGMDFDPTPPLGPPRTRTCGLEMVAVLDSQAVESSRRPA